MSRHNGSGKYLDAARKNGLEIKACKGSHYKVYSPDRRSMLVIPAHKELATGTEGAIRKWFLRMGIALVLILSVIYLLSGAIA